MCLSDGSRKHLSSSCCRCRRMQLDDGAAVSGKCTGVPADVLLSVQDCQHLPAAPCFILWCAWLPGCRYIYTRLAGLTRHVFNKADDKLLSYLNEESQSIEPEW
eukprot:GHRQ01014010.1.p6 GENE.GHRQ01014010.1~~GHRQ01014010.1.p6  ORF type:complete len:104 (-),score=38.39 GHRQ01014010.1:70-381(-)